MLNLDTIVAQLTQVELNGKPTFENVCNILDKLYGEPIIAPILDIPRSHIIFRARPVKSFDEVQTIEHISYPPKDKCHNFGRANMPEQPMFYGVVGENKRDMTIDAQLKLCISEACSSLAQPEHNVEYKVVVGIWQNSKELSGIPIINPDYNGNRSGINKTISKEFSIFIDNVDNGGEAEPKSYSVSEIINFQRFLHRKFTFPVQNSKEYWIPAKLTADLLQNKDIDGIFYESSKGLIDPNLNECLNIAIKPIVADEKLVFCALCDTTVVFLPEKERFHIANYRFRKLQ